MLEQYKCCLLRNLTDYLPQGAHIIVLPVEVGREGTKTFTFHLIDFEFEEYWAD